MRKSFSITDDLVFAAMFATVSAVITLGLMAADDGHPLVSSAGIVATEPSKVDGDIAPTSPTRPPLYASDTTTPRR